MFYLAKRGEGNGTGDEIVDWSETPGIAIPDYENSYDEFPSDFGIPEEYDPVYHQLYRGRDTENGWWTIDYKAKQLYEVFDAAFRDSTLFAKALGSTNRDFFTFLLNAMYCENRSAIHRFNDFFYALNEIIDGLPEPLTQTELDYLNGVLTECYFPTIPVV